MFLLILLLVLYNSKLLVYAKTKIECGYKQCPQTREGALNVHIIPHSHMDAGWVKTFDEYYYGTRSSVSTANVQLIYHSVLSELLHDKRRKFTFSETAYFWRWWKEQRPGTRATFRSLVQEGRAQFAGAGWTHADSSTLNYLQALDHATWGLRKLNDTLGPCGKPKAAWQIDTYGHSREMTSLLAQMGFDGLFIGRVDHKDREAMMEEDRMEFMWRGSDVLGKMSDIMTHTLFNLYNAPDGFCFDFLCNDEPIVDDPDSKVYNADKRVNDFVAHIERQAKYYDHDNIVVTMGGDFTYQSAPNWFMNIDKLINHVNTHPANLSDFNIFYSTPACYLKAIYLYGRRDKAIYTEKGDLLPYGSDSSTYWTGFYTSRPSLKFFVRRSHIFLQVVKQLTVIARSVDSYELHLLRHAVGLLSHHDAVTGTSQQHVTNDFIRTLSEAVEVCTKKISNLISYLTPTWGGNRRSKTSQQFFLCHQLNMSQCKYIESQESLLLLVYNPLSVKTYHYVRLPAIALHYSIRDFNDEEVEYQLVPLSAAITNLPGRTSNAIQELWFEAENIPPLGYTSYYLSPIRDQLEENNYAKKSDQKTLEADELIPHISNEYIKVTVDPNTGLLDSIQHLDGIKIKTTQNFYYYTQGHQPLQSGAYSFRPEKNRPTPVAVKAQYITIRGSLVKEIRQRFSDWITQIIRLFRGEEFIEFEWIIGPVPLGTDLGKEVVSIFSTNITNNGEFYTDSNGRQMMKRTCWNESATLQQKKPVPACYYPVTSRICIKSSNTSTEMCVLTDRTQGGTSYEEGEIELMTHRRLLTDDGFGLEETLNEEAFGVGLVVKGKHRVLFGNYRTDADGMTFSERVSSNARRWEYEPWLFFASGEKVNRRKWQNVRNKRYSALKVHGLPRHIHILTLEPWKGGSVLLRLENTLEKVSRAHHRRDSSDGTEDTSSYITVELRNIFLQLHLKSARETTLGANQWLEDARQMDWSTRYVYNGGEDGIQTEDQVEDENKSGKHGKESDEEDSEYPIKKVEQRRKINRNRLRSKSTKYIYERKRRSINTTDFGDLYNLETDEDDNLVKFNIIFNDPTSPPVITKVVELTKFRIRRSVNGTEKVNESSVNDTNNEFKVDYYNGSVDTTVDSYDMVTEKLRMTTRNAKRKQKRKSKNNFWNKNKQKLPTVDMIDEIRSSEEDFSLNLKKQSSKRKNKRNSKKKKEVQEIVYDDSDDVTTSIYEMYYKTKSQQRPKGLKTRRNKKRKNIDNYEVRGSRKRFGVHPLNVGKRRIMKQVDRDDNSEENHNNYDDEDRDSTSPRTLRRRNVVLKAEDWEDDEGDDDEDDEEDEDTRRRTRSRRKRLAKDDEANNQSEPETINEPEYMVTLRPTQIRTFVVWFDTTNKKSYNV